MCGGGVWFFNKIYTPGLVNNRNDIELSHCVGKAAIVKLYDLPEGEIKLTDILDVVGIISLDPAMALNEPNEASLFPPPSLVPRLHVVHFKKVCVPPHI